MTKVFDLREKGLLAKAEYSLPPREAVIAAHAQFENKDWETWNYEERYGHLVWEAKVSISCGNFSAWKEGMEKAENRLRSMELGID